jgi:hypothetical protein
MKRESLNQRVPERNQGGGGHTAREAQATVPGASTRAPSESITEDPYTGQTPETKAELKLQALS